MPMRRAVLMMRQGISPRLAIRIRLNMRRWDPECRLFRLCCGAAQMSTAVHGGKSVKVPRGAAAPAARQPAARVGELQIFRTVQATEPAPRTQSGLRRRDLARGVIGSPTVWI